MTIIILYNTKLKKILFFFNYKTTLEKKGVFFSFMVIITNSYNFTNKFLNMNTNTKSYFL